ncbi:DNA/RNA nuclease SfsA [Paraferrimonas haliotis]|uniref:Sugar fermentation stimulation protein homolog n=1 Tax=Paraferrimonas haliotis TaxID=2013866 RepID=A0AA37TRV7_9GAMM|nr:DNA/RNA nuclease SfsA [Paraferrimonas haliotis]GLS83142.1 sugar fermentation stimulation protein [Paraferrimonas haliotis]
MEFSSPLIKGRLLKRYKRFLADIELADGSVITAHCPNTGSMKHCLFPGHTVWLSESDNPKRKYPHTWELGQDDNGHMFSVNTGRANALAVEAINRELIRELNGYSRIQTEVAYGEEKSRIDLLLSGNNKPDCFVEIKSVTLHMGDGEGAFPDSVSTRGQKHLRELMHMQSLGHRAVLLFVVAHSGIDRVRAAKEIDEKYAGLLKEAQQNGVEVLAYCCEFNDNTVCISKQVAVL